METKKENCGNIFVKREILNYVNISNKFPFLKPVLIVPEGQVSLIYEFAELISQLRLGIMLIPIKDGKTVTVVTDIRVLRDSLPAQLNHQPGAKIRSFIGQDGAIHTKNDNLGELDPAAEDKILNMFGPEVTIKFLCIPWEVEGKIDEAAWQIPDLQTEEMVEDQPLVDDEQPLVSRISKDKSYQNIVEDLEGTKDDSFSSDSLENVTIQKMIDVHSNPIGVSLNAENDDTAALEVSIIGNEEELKMKAEGVQALMNTFIEGENTPQLTRERRLSLPSMSEDVDLMKLFTNLIHEIQSSTSTLQDAGTELNQEKLDSERNLTGEAWHDNLNLSIKEIKQTTAQLRVGSGRDKEHKRAFLNKLTAFTDLMKNLKVVDSEDENIIGSGIETNATETAGPSRNTPPIQMCQTPVLVEQSQTNQKLMFSGTSSSLQQEPFEPINLSPPVSHKSKTQEFTRVEFEDISDKENIFPN